MRLMTDHHFRHLPVLDGDRIAGIVSIGDLVNWIISAQTSTISQLQTYITGVPGKRIVLGADTTGRGRFRER